MTGLRKEHGYGNEKDLKRDEYSDEHYPELLPFPFGNASLRSFHCSRLYYKSCCKHGDKPVDRAFCSDEKNRRRSCFKARYQTSQHRCKMR